MCVRTSTNTTRKPSIKNHKSLILNRIRFLAGNIIQPIVSRIGAKTQKDSWFSRKDARTQRIINEKENPLMCVRTSTNTTRKPSIKNQKSLILNRICFLSGNIIQPIVSRIGAKTQRNLIEQENRLMGVRTSTNTTRKPSIKNHKSLILNRIRFLAGNIIHPIVSRIGAKTRKVSGVRKETKDYQ